MHEPDARVELWISGEGVFRFRACLAESVGYHAFFAGFISVTAWEVGQAYLRAISTPITGRILKLHKTNC